MSNAFEVVGLRLLADLVRDDRLEIERGHVLLAVGDLLEALERGVQRLAVDPNAEVLQRLAQRMAPGMLAQHDRVGLQADRRRIHDLVGRAVLQHAVLMDPGLVGEGVAAHDRLVRLNRIPREPRDEPARAGNLLRVEGRVEADARAARPQQHHDLLERRVARALADPVDRALDLTGARGQPGERVRDREPEVVVAVDGDHDLREIRHEAVELAEHVRILVRHRVPDRVGDVDRRRALLDRRLHDLGHELHVGAASVLGRELDVVAVLLGVRDGRARLSDDVLARGHELALDVDVGGRDEGVDARPLGVLDRVPGGVDVGRRRAREAADHRPLDRLGDRRDRFRVTGRGDREAGLDDVDPEPRELMGDLELFLDVQRDPRGLLAVAQRRVEDVDAVCAFSVGGGALRGRRL